MAQDKIKMGTTTSNLVEIRAPDIGLGYDFETTYTEDTSRLQNGILYLRPMFTVEALSYTATNVSKSEMTKILSYIAKGNAFYLHYFSPYAGTWVTNPFYVGKGSMTIGSYDENKELFSSLSFQMTGVDPL